MTGITQQCQTIGQKTADKLGYHNEGCDTDGRKKLSLIDPYRSSVPMWFMAGHAVCSPALFVHHS
jgi:hypothetical protein